MLKPRIFKMKIQPLRNCLSLLESNDLIDRTTK